MSNFFEKQIKGLVVILRVFGGLSVIFGALSLLAYFTSAGVELFSSFALLISGIIFWIVAKGLSKRKKWAWYLGLVAFVFSAVQNFVIGMTINLIAGGLAVLFIVILLATAKSFFQTSPSTNQ